MKTNKVFKWLYGIFMFLPMLAIGVTCAYVTFNKNAKDSYSGINETTYTNYDDVDDLPLNTTIYSFLNNNKTYADTGAFPISNLQIIDTNRSLSFDASQIGYIRFYTTKSVLFSDANNTSIQSVAITGSYYLNMSFEITNTANMVDIGNLFSQIETDSYRYMDNTFYYAVEQFNESGFNKVDFVSFFNMFYNNTNIWTTFANTYINYMLFVSVCFFIPRVLFWFINFSFSIVDSFTEKSQRW